MEIVGHHESTSAVQAFLRLAPWAQGLSVNQLDRVIGEVEQREVASGSFVYRRGDAAEHWIGVVSGLVKISRDSSTGRSLMLAAVPAGGWFGDGALLSDEPRRYSALALRPTSLVFMPRSTFTWLHRTSLSFNQFLVRYIHNRYRQAAAMLEGDRLLERDERIARCLALLFDPDLYPGRAASVEISQEEIGQLSGLTRQHVNKALQSLKQRDFVRIERRGITVLDLDALKRLGR
jgi:CRP/FNR family transcriptional regulator, cyclic AMP receptor protein